MTVAYFDCFSGISGDMVLGALVDAGVPFEELKAALAQLPVTGYHITSRRVQRCGIGATQVQVKLTNDESGPNHDHHHHDHDHGHHHRDHDHHDHEHHHDYKRDHDHHDHHHHDHHHHDHSHQHDHDHGHTHSHGDHDHDHGHHHHAPHRGFTEISAIINSSPFSPTVKQRAIAAFHRIAIEEAAVHETTVEAVHFHEVGAVDAIVDIVGAMWCIERLGITRVIASPVAVGSGTIRVAHGEMPIPAPATARLLAGKPICTGPVSGELTTPTGAAILTTLAEEFGPLQDFAISRVAYGAGTREYPHHTNYLRVLLGSVSSTARPVIGASLPLIREDLHLITTEIDDMPAELLGAAMETLLAAGALDVHFIPIQMKKNRPAVSLHVLTRADAADALLQHIFSATTTLGVKVLPCLRLSLHRRTETVHTTHGPVKVKLGLWADQPAKASPEYEECRALAAATGGRATAMQIYQEASALATALLSKDKAQ